MVAWLRRWTGRRSRVTMGVSLVSLVVVLSSRGQLGLDSSSHLRMVGFNRLWQMGGGGMET